MYIINYKQIMQNLPRLCLFEIFKYLDNIDDFRICYLMCKNFNRTIDDSWKLLLDEINNNGDDYRFIFRTDDKNAYIKYLMIKKLKNEFSLKNASIRYIYNCHNFKLNIGIRYISKEIYALNNLARIDLSHNKITEIPKELSVLYNLQLLKLSHNKITSIPKELSYLVNLSRLDFSYNRIRSLPKELSYLVNLETLWLYNNKITKIPNELSALDNLEDLRLDNNKIISIPYELTIHIRNKPMCIY